MSRSRQEIAAHRGQISALIDTVLDGYWQADLSQMKRNLILSDWCDELEDWPVESVKAALRHWRRVYPDKKPNPGHVLQILKRAWGERHADQVKLVRQRLRVAESLNTPDIGERQAISRDVAAAYPGMFKRIPR